jgi:hypothetical protein
MPSSFFSQSGEGFDDPVGELDAPIQRARVEGHDGGRNSHQEDEQQGASAHPYQHGEMGIDEGRCTA